MVVNLKVLLNIQMASDNFSTNILHYFRNSTSLSLTHFLIPLFHSWMRKVLQSRSGKTFHSFFNISFVACINFPELLFFLFEEEKQKQQTSETDEGSFHYDVSIVKRVSVYMTGEQWKSSRCLNLPSENFPPANVNLTLALGLRQ